ncbi:DUF4365 domain-containing protein [Bremerella alba]|uniref:DUF4365 domain-containing protein n=1 Tax=Bremerella alba TaxID=980252 RepID=A0A7V8V1B5_9BACT|nr:DUF4365 domain-containing protein [Bremerella alba]MBA2113021.1 hypothetical protein [Bremerella alba]
MPLVENEIEAELSYAFLHAVASRVGCSCSITNRHVDGMGVDAILHVDDEFGDAPVCRFSVDVQLKATVKSLPHRNGSYSYSLKKPHYDKLRRVKIENAYILIVLQLPRDSSQWLKCSKTALTMKKCAHWVSLYGAPESTNDTEQTIYLPDSNLVTPDALRELLSRFAWRERIPYVV